MASKYLLTDLHSDRLRCQQPTLSSNFVKKQRFVRGRFSWQEGYGAFSYGHSQLDTIIRYIQNQEEHHKRSSFKREYLALLRKFDIACDDKYVFDFID